MRWWLAALAVVAVGAAACASRSSPTATDLLVRPIDAGPPPPQPATIEEAIGGRKFTGYARLSRDDDDRLVMTPCVGVYAFTCNKAMAAWQDGGRVGRAPCATVTLALDTESPNFYVASGWTVAPIVARSAELVRMGSGFVPGVGGAVTTSVASSPLLDSMMRNMYGGLFEVVGATTPEACEVLRPPETTTRIDGRCRPAHLDIY